jgi:hypothetical protein
MRQPERTPWVVWNKEVFRKGETGMKKASSDVLPPIDRKEGEPPCVQQEALPF